MPTTAGTRRTRATAATVLAGGCLCASLSACGGDRDNPGNSFNPVSAETSADAPAAAFAAPGANLASPVPRPSTETGPLPGSQPFDVLPSEGTRMKISEVRAATHDGFDRIVVELDGDGSPGWYVSTDDRPTADGSGNPVSYDGDTALVIDVRGLVGDSDHSAPVDNVARGVIGSVQSLGVFEGTQRIVVGLDVDDPTFTVSRLDDPTRVVVDVMDN